ncbi:MULTISPECIES: hypothetical protein [Lachnospiraceae]|uniref:Endonuclease/Exonuclease/phosphatase family protein n=3 Tax=Enterocloster TaxID=2719313 RepID=A0A1I0J855_9FIRM|nr:MULTISPECIES: hypothetical protein [Lachnospiraceae]KMW10661.1 hypothetical protein HMPREF9470_05511 [[Clostridium] citroniae WAL-19142]MDB2017784.1 hypothetical protein [[Clostridium] symbiosum]PST30162.1 hypothetical protein C7256_26450 [Enterocloster lavalensis]SEU05869.1 hypothetical protein SAMN05216313_12730 [Enterocloster lavalensis]
MNILFWNTHNNMSLDDTLIDLVLERNCTLLVLAEYENDINELCKKMNLRSKTDYKIIPSYGGCTKIKAIIAKKYNVEIVREQNRYQIIKIETSYYKMLVAMIHNISKYRATEEEQSENLRQLHEDVIIAENEQGTRNAVVIGDLNVNPFEKACVAANTMHAIPYASEVSSAGRLVQQRMYREFYNPMWGLLGKRNSPQGTMFYNNGGIINYFWHIVDQFLVRPEMIDALNEDSIEIVIGTKTENFLKKNGRPDPKRYSDHLPIYVQIKEDLIK